MLVRVAPEKCWIFVFVLIGLAEQSSRTEQGWELGLCAGSWMGCDRAGRRVWGQLSQILCVVAFRGLGKALSQHRAELRGVGRAVLEILPGTGANPAPLQPKPLLCSLSMRK